MKPLTLILILFTFTSFAQNISGIVLDEKTNTPLKDVNVFIKASKIGVISNDKGEFNLDMSREVNKKASVSFSSIGYITRSIPILELTNENNTIYLSKSIVQLKEVTVTANIELKTKINYNKLASLKNGIHSFGSLLVDDKIYVIGGDASYLEDHVKKAQELYGTIKIEELLSKMGRNQSWEGYRGDLLIYDNKTDRWTTSNLKLRKRAYNTLNYHNNKLYVLGGKRLSINRKYEYLDDKIEIIDLKTQTIKIDDTNPHQAINSSSFTYNNSIIVMGGSIKLKKEGTKLYTNKSHIYNIDSGYWYELEDMPIAKETSGILIKNIIYLIGGFNGNLLKDVETYNLTTGKWNNEGELFYGIEKPALTFNNDKIYIFDDGKISIFNIKTNQLDEYLIDLYLKSSELYYLNNKLYILGGFLKDEYSKTPSSKLYSIDLNAFEQTKINKSKILK